MKDPETAAQLLEILTYRGANYEAPPFYLMVSRDKGKIIPVSSLYNIFPHFLPSPSKCGYLLKCELFTDSDAFRKP